MSDTRGVEATWVKDHRFVVTTASGHALILDNPGREGGSAASPMEAVLAAVAGCSGIDVINILEKGRQPLERLEVSVDGVRRDEQPRIYTAITVVFRVWGAVDAKKLLRAVHLSEETYCSVSAMLKSSATISTRVELNGSDISSND